MEFTFQFDGTLMDVFVSIFFGPNIFVMVMEKYGFFSQMTMSKFKVDFFNECFLEKFL